MKTSLLICFLVSIITVIGFGNVTKGHFNMADETSNIQNSVDPPNDVDAPDIKDSVSAAKTSDLINELNYRRKVSSRLAGVEYEPYDLNAYTSKGFSTAKRSGELSKPSNDVLNSQRRQDFPPFHFKQEHIINE